MVDMLAGSVPTRLLPWKSSKRSDVRLLIWTGMEPVRLGHVSTQVKTMGVETPCETALSGFPSYCGSRGPRPCHWYTERCCCKAHTGRCLTRHTNRT